MISRAGNILLMDRRLHLPVSPPHRRLEEIFPKTLESQINLMFDSIKPPNPTVELQEKLLQLKFQTKMGIVDMVIKHLEECQEKTEEALKSLYETDGDAAGYIAVRQLKRFGRKMPSRFIFNHINLGLRSLKVNDANTPSLAPITAAPKGTSPPEQEPIDLPEDVVPLILLPLLMMSLLRNLLLYHLDQ